MLRLRTVLMTLAIVLAVGGYVLVQHASQPVRPVTLPSSIETGAPFVAMDARATDACQHLPQQRVEAGRSASFDGPIQSAVAFADVDRGAPSQADSAPLNVVPHQSSGVRTVSHADPAGCSQCGNGPSPIPAQPMMVGYPPPCASCPTYPTCPTNCGSCQVCACGDRSPLLNGRGVRPFKNHPDCGAECGVRRQITGVDSATCVNAGEPDWGMRQPIPWESHAQGEYIGPARSRHLNKYRLRVDDVLTVVFRITRNRTAQAYELNVGDEIRVESAGGKELDRKLVIQPDGSITLPFLGQVTASGRTTDELRRDLEKRYEAYYNEPAITVTPEKMNTKLDDLRATVDARAGIGGQQFQVTIAPDGTIQLPALGSLPANGLTLEELKYEIDSRYARIVRGLEATPVLAQRAPRFIYVVGEVQQPGRVELVGPTTVTQAIALAEGWINGANLRNVVVFRRAEDWRLLATKVDIQGALYGRRPAPSDELWLRDSDVLIVPKNPIKVIDDAIELLFTNGIYAAAPFFTESSIFSSDTTL